MSMSIEKPTKATAAKQARERARLNRARLDADRVVREQKIESAATEYFELEFDAAQLREQLEAVEAKRGASIRSLRELGEKDPWIAELLETDVKEISRLAKLTVE